MWNDTISMTLIYDIKVILVILISCPLFFKHAVKRKKIGSKFPEIRCFHFFHATHFHLKKEDFVVRQLPIASQIFCCRDRVRLSSSVKVCWKCWVASEIRNTFWFQLYLEKVENGEKLVETTTMITGSNDTEFGYPLKCLTIYYR